jgi:AAA ATPase domain
MEGWHEDLVGREQELASIDRFLAETRSTPGALLIEGPAGAGKTTVWRAGVERARVRGQRVLSCRPARAEVHLLYGGLSDLFVEHVGEALPRLPKPQRRAIEVVLLLEGDGRPADQRALAAGVLTTLRELATDQPLLLAIDDAQWLDPASVLVIEYVLRRLRDVYVGVLASWRHAPIESGSRSDRDRQLDLGRALGEPPRRLPIGPLSPGAIHQILRNRTGHPFPRPLMRRIYEASGGNPFFALEIARAMDARRDEWTTGEPLALSVSLNELLADRFAGLPTGTRDALFVAAAASQPTPALVEAALSAPAKPLLDPAVETGLIRVTDGHIEFAHPLLAAAAHSLPDTDERRQWHLRLAQVSPDVEARAHHLALARPNPDWKSPSSCTRPPRRPGPAARPPQRGSSMSARSAACPRAISTAGRDGRSRPHRSFVRQASCAARERSSRRWPDNCPRGRSGPTCSWPSRAL